MNKKTNHERALRRIYSRYKSSAKRRKIEWELSEDEVFFLVEQRCSYCNSEGSNYIKAYDFAYNGIDRLNSSQSYNMDNVCTCCAFCNSVKGSMPLETWIDFITGIVDRSKEDPWWLHMPCDTERKSKRYGGYYGKGKGKT